MTGSEVGPTVLGLEAEALNDENVPVVMGDGRELRGRVVVSDEARQQVLFPGPSEELLEGLRSSGGPVRPNDIRLSLIRLD